MAPMRTRGRVFAWAIGLAAPIAIGLWAASGKAPRLPADGDHAVAQAEARCLGCHMRAGAHPRPAGHPLRDDCFSCHRDHAGVLHPRRGAPTSLPGGWRDDPVLAGRASGGGKDR
jgi:hypothetical protein